MSSHLLRLVLIVTILCLGSNSLPAADLSGHWEGRWQSCTTGHQGVLRADFCRTSDSTYAVHFSGRFFKVFPFRYSVTLNVVEEGDTVRLQGSSFLGRMFGTFCYTAVSNGCEFTSDYTSKKDCGRFTLTKCGR